MLRIFDVRGGNTLTTCSPVEVRGIKEAVYLSIDGSTTCTGMTLLTERAVPLFTFAVAPDEKTAGDAVRYKLYLKSILTDILINNMSITKVFYEEPVLEYANNVKSLFGLRTVVPEILIENESFFKGRVQFLEIPNGKWKKIFLAPDSVPAGSVAQKEAVRRRAESIFPWTKDPRITQDECDSLGMGVACGGRSFVGLSDTLESAKKVRPFKYHIHFVGGNFDIDAVGDILQEMKTWKPKVPSKFEGETFVVTELNGRGLFEKKIYSAMGDQDKLLILKFKSTQYQNIVLEHGLQDLVPQYKYIYAVVWRQTRKGNNNGK